MATNKAPFTFHLDEDVLNKIKFIAKEDTRSTSNLLEHICKLRIIEYENKHGEIILDIEE